MSTKNNVLKKDKKQAARTIAIIAIMFALIFVAMMLDKVISLFLLVSVSTAAITLLVTFSLCFLYNEWWMGFGAGIMFGFASWLTAFIFQGPMSVYTVNPLVSVLPRVIVGIGAFSVYRLVLMFFRNRITKTAQITAITIATVVGLVLNTVLFLTALNVCKQAMGSDFTALFEIVKLVLFTNIIPEYSISILVAPWVVLGVRHGLKLGIDGNNYKRAIKSYSENSH
jgi:uncharacterized membrane protein